MTVHANKEHKMLMICMILRYVQYCVGNVQALAIMYIHFNHLSKTQGSKGVCRMVG